MRVQQIWSISLLFILAGCSSSQTHPFSFDVAEDPIRTKRLWSKKLNGLVTDLSLSRDGKGILVATIPNPDKRGTIRQLRLLDHEGEVKWALRPKSVIKEQDVANSGEMTFITTYDEKMTAYDKAGKEIWSVGELCSPKVINKAKHVLCLYDDDSQPTRAFDVFDSKTGKRVFRKKIKRDILTLKISKDESSIVYGLVGGWVYLLNSKYRRVWRTRVKGEIVDLVVSSGKKPTVAVVFNPNRKSKKRNQKLAVINHKGKVLDHIDLSTQIEKLAIHNGGSPILAYGNNPRGQSIALFSRSPALEKKWQYQDKHYADYSSSLVVGKDQVMVGFENVRGRKNTQERISHLFGFDFDGKAKWDLPLKTDSGAYLYVKNFSAEERFLLVATDAGVLSAYEFR